MKQFNEQLKKYEKELFQKEFEKETALTELHNNLSKKREEQAEELK